MVETAISARAISRRTSNGETVAQSIEDDPSGSTVRSAGYVISLVEGVADMDAVRRYAAATGPSIEAHGGRFMASNSQLDVVEGHTKLLRASIVEFASLDCAQAWYALEGVCRSTATESGSIPRASSTFR
jgi:uncharacterized protein (DUF1330 family)